LLARPEAISDMQAATVWYFGDDHEVYCALQARLPHTLAWGDTGRRLNDIAEQFTDDFVNLADRFDVADWDWWESRNIAERGPLSSTFTTECCRMILFGKCLDRKGSNVFICDAGDLARVLLEEARRRGTPATWIGKGTIAQAVELIAEQTTAALRFARVAIRRIGRLRRLRALRRARPVPLDRLRRCDILFAAWTVPGDFPSPGPRDVAHYMGALPRELRARGLTVGFLALPLDWIGDGNAINAHVAAADEAVFLPDDAIGVGDIVAMAARALFSRAFPTEDLRFSGQPLASVARMVMRRERFDWRAVNARLLAGVGSYLAGNGIRPTTVFHVYENQTWEKGLRAGLRRALPDVKIAGVHQSPFSKLYLNMLPSRVELSTGRWPDIVFTHGARSRRQLTSTGAPDDRVIDAGLFRPSAFVLRPVPGARRSGRLIIATGVDFHECCELVSKASQAAARAAGDWQVIANFHPAAAPAFRTRLQQFLAAQPGNSANIEFVERPIPDLLKGGAAAILYADTNAAFEAVSSGAQAINVERDHALSFDKLADGLARRLYTVDEIALSLDELTDEDAWPSRNDVALALNDCFSPADADKILSVLGLALGNAGGEPLKVMEEK
tara:strand:+ start:65796 stop:67643 length:1848 start_codon:yes stop_codon:yes gene_type:complete